MPSLLIDTSTQQCILALYQEVTLLDVLEIAHYNNLSKALLPSIDTLLKRQQLTIQDLDDIALGIGPGSYTGTRVGAATAKMLSFGLKIPLKTFHSPSLFIPPSIQGPFTFVIPTKPGPLFLLHGKVDSKGYLHLPLQTEHIFSFKNLPKKHTLISASPLESTVPAKLNLPLLIPSLDSITAESAEKAVLSYLHTPIAG